MGLRLIVSISGRGNVGSRSNPFVASSTILLAILFISFFYLNEVEEKERERFFKKVKIATELHNELGFNASIHHFKNYVIRRDEKYYDLALIHLEKTLKLTNEFLELSDSKKLIGSILGIRHTATLYHKNLGYLKNLVGKNKYSIEELDRKVRVDDSNASKAITLIISTLRKEWDEKMHKAAQLRRTSFFIIFFFFLIRSYLLHRNSKKVRDNVLELQTSNRNLSIANEELDEFGYRLSHDIRSPVATTKRLLGFIQEDIESGELAEALNNIVVSQELILKLDRLIENIIRMTKDKLQVGAEELVNVSRMREGIAEIFEPLAEEKEINFILNFNSKRDHYSYEKDLFLIAWNLVDNAIKYTQQGGEVSLFLADDNKNLFIRITDNGSGFEAKNKDDVYKLFKKFHVDRNNLGSGMGMYMVKKAVDRLGGNIQYQTSKKGTYFAVTIPTKGIKP